MSLAPDQIRSRVTASILSSLGSGWTRSRHPYAAFGVLDGRQLEHKTVVVGLPSTDPGESRQAVAVGIKSATALGVRFAYRLRVDNAYADENDALVAEQLVVEAIRVVQASAGNPQLNCIITGIRRETLTDDAGHTFRGEVLAVVHHHYPLTH